MTCSKGLNQDRLHGIRCPSRSLLQRTSCLLLLYFFLTLILLLVLTSPLHYVTNRENFGHPLSMTVTGMSRCSLPRPSRIHSDLLSCHSSYRALRLPLPKYTVTLPKKLSPRIELVLSHLTINAASCYLLDNQGAHLSCGL